MSLDAGPGFTTCNALSPYGRQIVDRQSYACHCERSAAFGRNQKLETTKSTKDAKK
jgi:hypothetical protein